MDCFIEPVTNCSQKRISIGGAPIEHGWIQHTPYRADRIRLVRAGV
jgi:hypothetical protein